MDYFLTDEQKSIRELARKISDEKVRPARAELDEEASQRALENPEVKRFQELFQGSQVRTVRNLKQ